MDGDNALFLALKGIKRLKPSDRLPPDAKPLPAPTPRQQQLDDLAVMAELLQDPAHPEDFESGDTLTYRSPSLPDATWRKLRRGAFRLESECDLHGLNRDQARLQMSEFLLWCKQHNARHVRVIHGKGNGSPNSGPVLKRYVDGWLRKSASVLGFCSARPCDGGTGAIYVLLRGG